MSEKVIVENLNDSKLNESINQRDSLLQINNTVCLNHKQIGPFIVGIDQTPDVDEALMSE